MASLYGIDNKNARPNLVKNAQFGVFFASACKFAYMIMQIRDPPPSLTMRESKRLPRFACALTGICRSFVITPSLAISYTAILLPKMFDSQIRPVSPKALQEKVDDLPEAFPAERGLTRFDVRHDHMDGRRRRLEPHTPWQLPCRTISGSSSLSLIRRRHNDPVSGLPGHLSERC